MTFFCMLFLCCFGSPPRRPKRVQEAPKRPQEAPQSALRGPKRLPKAPQEAPRGPQETSRVGPEGSKPAQELPRASQDAHKAFPKHLARQPFSENSKHSKHGSKRHRRSLRSPISMNPEGLAPNRDQIGPMSNFTENPREKTRKINPPALPQTRSGPRAPRPAPN